MLTRIGAIVLAVALTGAHPAAQADAVLDWNAIMASTVAGQNPFAQARFAAITQLAVFEAVDACSGRYKPYLGTVTAPEGASGEAAAIAAAHAVLRHYFPASASALDSARAASLAAIPDGASENNGIIVGEAAAAAMIEARLDDGAAPPATFLRGATDPGVWQPTPPAFVPGILLHWGGMTSFGMAGGDQFRSAPPPSLTSRRYARDYEEVRTAGSIGNSSRSQYHADVARFFAVVSAMDTGAVDGNPRTDAEPGWLPFIATPPFPGYPSAHASASYAARTVVERLFGRHHVRFELSHPGVPGVVLAYDSFRDLTSDIDDARVYGGIHFRFDQEAGAMQGRQVGAYVLRHNLNRNR